jgi:hypothetical protein
VWVKDRRCACERLAGFVDEEDVREGDEVVSKSDAIMKMTTSWRDLM